MAKGKTQHEAAGFGRRGLDFKGLKRGGNSGAVQQKCGRKKTGSGCFLPPVSGEIRDSVRLFWWNSGFFAGGGRRATDILVILAGRDKAGAAVRRSEQDRPRSGTGRGEDLYDAVVLRKADTLAGFAVAGLQGLYDRLPFGALRLLGHDAVGRQQVTGDTEGKSKQGFLHSGS